MKNKKQKGITLVALVVTIVVLLILAGVSINLVLGENGLITQAKEAKEQTKTAESNEKESMDSVSDWISETVNDTELPQTKETKPYKPSEEFTKVEGTNLGNGLVIQDANGNQYVWVEVPMTSTVYPTAGLNITEFNEDEYIKIENDLHTYTATYRNNTNYTDTWYEDTTNPDDWYTEAEYNEAKQKMLKSIYQNGGFWVGRYEAGIEEAKNRTENNIAPIEAPRIKEGLCPYTNLTRTQAKKIAEMIEYGTGENKHIGSLMFGVQWDLILKFIEIKKISTDTNIITKLKSDSTTVGNYYNSVYTINRGKYAVYSQSVLNNIWNLYTKESENYVEVNSKKISQNKQGDGILLTTGATEESNLMNIYDIAGNVWEWTLEYTSSGNNNSCVVRGSCCFDTGTENPTSIRGYGADYYSYSNIGFRLVIY